MTSAPSLFLGSTLDVCSSSIGAAAGGAAAASAPPASAGDDVYVLRVLLSSGVPAGSTSAPSLPFLAAACSDGALRVFDLHPNAGMAMSLRFSLQVADGKKTTIRDIAIREASPLASGGAGGPSPIFSGGNPSILVAVDMGFIHVVDAVTGREALRWKLPNAIKKPSKKGADDADYGLYSLAVNSRGDLVAVSCVAQVLFYSVKSDPPRLLGCYIDAHTEPVTQLAFLPPGGVQAASPSAGPSSSSSGSSASSTPRYIASAGDDGLLCLIDTTVKGEDEAIVTVCNAESSIAHFGLFGPNDKPCSFAWVCTRTLTLSLWNLETGEQLARFDNLFELFSDAGLFICELLGCRYRDDADSTAPYLELFTCDGDGQLYVWKVEPPKQGGLAGLYHEGSSAAAAAGSSSGAGDSDGAGSSVAGSFKRGGANGFTITPAYQLQAGAHSSCARCIEWGELLVPRSSTTSTTGPAATVAFTAGEDGKISFWGDAVAGHAVASAAAAASSVGVGASASGQLFVRSKNASVLSSVALSTGRAGAVAGGSSRDDSELFASVDPKRPVSPPQTNGSGTAAAAFLFGEDNAGDGSLVEDAALAVKIQQAAERAGLMEEEEHGSVARSLAGAGAGSSMLSEVRKAREKGKLNPFAPSFKHSASSSST